MCSNLCVVHESSSLKSDFCKVADQEYTMASKHVIDSSSLECCLCFQIMKEPKQLKCTHTFCKDCLVKYTESTRERNQITCPLCREVTPLKKGDVSELQTNIPLKSVIEDVTSGLTICTMCDEKSQSPAVRFCKECSDFMCEACLDVHRMFKKTARHATCTVEDAISGKFKVKRKCTEHPLEDKEWVCTTCTQSVCFRCRVLDHGGSDHEIEDVTTYIKALTNNIQSLQIEINAALDSFQDETQEIVDVELPKVDPCVDKIIMKINKAYDDQIQQYNEKRGKLIKECNTIRDQIKGELHKIRDERELKLGCITSANDLIENGLDTLIEGHARSVHDNVCGRLQEDLASVNGHDGKDLKRAKEVVSRAECLTFTPYRINAEHSLGEVSYNHWRLEKRNELALTSAYAYSLTATRDGKMVVGYEIDDGVEVCSVNESQERRMQGKDVQCVSVLRDGRYVLRDWYGYISLYTQTWEECNGVSFQRVDAYGSMDVDGCDHIYVGCKDAKVVRVFTPVGGPPVREIPCHGYEPWIVRTTNHSEMLALSDHLSVRVVDGEGNVMYDVSNKGFSARVAVLQDDNILIGWTKADRVNVDLYTNQLRRVRRVLDDYPVNSYMYGCSFREFSTGEIALCDESQLHIFRKTSVPLTGETS